MLESALRGLGLDRPFRLFDRTLNPHNTRRADLAAVLDALLVTPPIRTPVLEPTESGLHRKALASTLLSLSWNGTALPQTTGEELWSRPSASWC